MFITGLDKKGILEERIIFSNTMDSSTGVLIAVQKGNAYD